MLTKPVSSISLTDRTRSSAIAVLRAAAEQLERLPRRRAGETLLRIGYAVDVVRREVLRRRTIAGEE
jgi:hypothetical protein